MPKRKSGSSELAEADKIKIVTAAEAEAEKIASMVWERVAESNC